MSWYDLDVTFDLVVVTLTLKMLSGLYLGNYKASEISMEHWLGGVGVDHHCVTFTLGSA